MKRSLSVKCLSLTTIILCVSCAVVAIGQTRALPAKDANGASVRTVAQETETVVARIGEYTITQEELKARLLQDIRPREDDNLEDPKPVTAEATLRKMVAEKAMSMEGRKLGYLQDEIIQSSIERIEHQQLVRMLLENYVSENMSIDESQIDRVQKADPNMSREQATAVIQRSVVTRLLEKFYNSLLKKFQLTKVEKNFAEAVRIHQRLLLRPATPRRRGEYWIKNSQVREELSDAETALVLATYKGGQFTLKDWFKALCNIVPPRRPANLNTAAGLEQLLDQALRTPILVAEARARGYDKDETLRSRIRQVEDQRLFYKVQEQKTKGIDEPTAEQIKACFEKDKERFGQNATLKVDEIWCEDLATAKKVKGLLGEGEDFETVKKDHSLRKDGKAHNVYPGGEGLFWTQLWKGEPNDVLGPVKGFYESGLRWRVVKVLEKTPAKVPEYSEQIANRVKWAMVARERQRVLAEYRKELLQKYPHKIFDDRIKGMDPLEIAMEPADK